MAELVRMRERLASWSWRKGEPTSRHIVIRYHGHMSDKDVFEQIAAVLPKTIREARRLLACIIHELLHESIFSFSCVDSKDLSASKM